MTLATNWVDNIGMFVNAAYLNQNGTETNANTAARTQYGARSAMPAAAASNSGATYFCTDCDAVYESNGSAWTKIRVGGQLASSALADPPTSGWTAVNMQTGWTWAADKDSMLFTAPSVGSGVNWGYQYRAYPTPPFTLTACLEQMVSATPAATSEANAGLVISDGTKIIAFGPFAISSASAPFGDTTSFATAIKYSSATVYNSAYFATPSKILGGIPKWFRFTDNGTNIILEYSMNGTDWFTAVNEARTAFLTPTRIGIGANNYSGARLFSRLRSWNGVA